MFFIPKRNYFFLLNQKREGCSAFSLSIVNITQGFLKENTKIVAIRCKSLQALFKALFPCIFYRFQGRGKKILLGFHLYAIDLIIYHSALKEVPLL